MKIEDLGKDIRKILNDNNIYELFPIQEVGVEKLLENRSIIMKAPTGSGKTLSYVIPTIMKIIKNMETEKTNTIVLVPNKELGSQIRNEFKKFIDSVIFLPNEGNIKRQIESIRKKKPLIYVGQSNRILRLLDERVIKGNKVNSLILDEVDKLFIGRSQKEVEIITKKFYKDVPIYGFSATFDDETLAYLQGLKEDIYFLEDNKRMGKIDYYYIMSKFSRKVELTFKFLRSHDFKKTILFINSVKGVKGFEKYLMSQRRSIYVLHEDMDMTKRKDEIEKFRKDKFAILVTTDIMSRGLDVVDVDSVINFDIPRNRKSLHHRCGRTSRGNNDGTVLFLVEESEKGKFYSLRASIDSKVNQIAFDKEGKEILIKAKTNNNQNNHTKY